MGNEENRVEKRKNKEKSNKKRLIKRIILCTLAFILIFSISVFGYVYFKYGSFLGQVFDIVKDVKQDVIKVEEPINVLLLGMDIGDTNDVGNKDIKRTDTIILANFDPITKKAKLVSIPRDTRVKIGGKSQKINAAYPIGGEKLVKDIVSNMLDVKVNYVVKVDYEGFRGIIDAIGGVDMYIEQDMNYDDPGQDLHIHFNEGETVHLDGQKAEEFFRWRKNNDGTGLANGDIDRIKNQQKLMNAVIDKVLSFSMITKIDNIADVLNENIETDLPLDVTVAYGLKALETDSSNIQMVTLPGEGKYIGDVSYYIPDEKATKELKSELNSSDLSGRKNVIPSLAREELSIKVLNCTKINGLAGNVQKQLSENGYPKVDVGNGESREESQILIKDESSRAFMENDLKIKDIKKGIPSKYDSNGTYDVVILLGKDFKNFGEMQ
ncbi:LCP family protein [Clostridium sp. LIBA-8841]|uniref:LCP family protein n=1 Tax=Clostridium sp. LIBA-8841 TaxID=2987530 RepID=UPI002AC50DED|nr:LCP family protein [Clostridium sp. LIBA-8841]MDZ5253073.1 LCP family protein [Clostridium sp. LIBA-8841]